MDEELKKSGDFISADDVSSMPTQSPLAREKVLSFLSGVFEDDPKLWTAIKTIAEQSQVSPVYTRNVLDTLVSEKAVERAYMGKKQYFRIQK